MINGDANSQILIKKRLTVWLHAGFVFIGILTVLLGQILPFLTGKLSLNDEQAGYFFVAQFAAAFLGTFFYNRAVGKFGYLKVLFISFCVMAIGCGALNFNWWILCLSAVFIYGFGLGATIPAINLLIIELNCEKSAAAASLVNFSWGIGAILSKPFVDHVGSPESILLPTALLGAFLIIIGALILLSNYKESDVTETTNSDVAKTKIWTQPIAWLIAAFGFVQVGIESSVAGWLTTYELRLTETDLKRWFSAALVYFLFVVVGRGIAPLFLKFYRETLVMFAGLFVMTAGIVLILLTENFYYLIVGVGLLGLGASSIFPMNLARFTRFFGDEATKNAMPLFVMGNFGGAFMTWFIGFISTNFNSLRAGLSVILVCCLALIFLQIVLSEKLSK